MTYIFLNKVFKSFLIVFETGAKQISWSSRQLEKNLLNDLLKDCTILAVAHRIRTIDDSGILFII